MGCSISLERGNLWHFIEMRQDETVLLLGATCFGHNMLLFFFFLANSSHEKQVDDVTKHMHQLNKMD